ncbi:MAG: hypothetical protein QXT83_06295, partial [Sulfolobales archaeon]
VFITGFNQLPLNIHIRANTPVMMLLADIPIHIPFTPSPTGPGPKIYVSKFLSTHNLKRLRVMTIFVWPDVLAIENAALSITKKIIEGPIIRRNSAAF